MSRYDQTACRTCRRRRFLQTGAGLAGAGATALWAPSLVAAASDTAPDPIPNLDKNGHHNDPPMSGAEPSEIYHFNGKVATCHLVGTGKDSNGTPFPFGSPGTDFRFMQGEYVSADGSHHVSTYAHI